MKYWAKEYHIDGFRFDLMGLIDRETMLQVLDQSKPGDRLIVGVTEDVPNDHWRKSFLAIMQTLKDHGKLPLR